RQPPHEARRFFRRLAAWFARGGLVSRIITARPLTRQAFAEFGEVIEAAGEHYPINSGKAERYHALATAEARGPYAKVVISIVKGTAYDFPLRLTMVERHPLGSQAFVPLSPRPYLVVVCHDHDGRPGEPHAFV